MFLWQTYPIEANTHFPPLQCVAIWNPPIPAKRSMNVNSSYFTTTLFDKANILVEY